VGSLKKNLDEREIKELPSYLIGRGGDGLRPPSMETLKGEGDIPTSGKKPSAEKKKKKKKRG